MAKEQLCEGKRPRNRYRSPSSVTKVGIECLIEGKI
jgi:hypothetical protein